MKQGCLGIGWKCLVDTFYYNVCSLLYDIFRHAISKTKMGTMSRIHYEHHPLCVGKLGDLCYVRAYAVIGRGCDYHCTGIHCLLYGFLHSFYTDLPLNPHVRDNRIHICGNQFIQVQGIVDRLVGISGNNHLIPLACSCTDCCKYSTGASIYQVICPF